MLTIKILTIKMLTIKNTDYENADYRILHSTKSVTHIWVMDCAKGVLRVFVSVVPNYVDRHMCVSGIWVTGFV